MCRPPPKPRDGQNNLDIKAKRGELPKFHYASEETANYKPPKPPFILDGNGEVIGIIENVVPKTRPPLKPPRIHSSVNIEEIDLEKECLLNHS